MTGSPPMRAVAVPSGSIDPTTRRSVRPARYRRCAAAGSNARIIRLIRSINVGTVNLGATATSRAHTCRACAADSAPAI